MSAQLGFEGWVIDPAPMAAHEEPSARLETHGTCALADSELVDALCGGAVPTAMETARRLVADAGNLAALALWPVARLERAGLKRGLALRLVAAVEIGRRAAQVPAAQSPMLDHAEGVAQ
jgi:DNA repair protein RadC